MSRSSKKPKAKPAKQKKPEGSSDGIKSNSPSHERFIQEYLVDTNATQAAIRAGYSKKTANEQGARLLANVSIRSEVERRLMLAAERANVKAERVIAELAILGFSDIGDILDFSGPEPKLKPANTIPERARRAISSIKVKRIHEPTGDVDARGRKVMQPVDIIEFKLWPKDGALEKLCRHLGLFNDDQPDPEKAKPIQIVVVNQSGLAPRVGLVDQTRPMQIEVKPSNDSSTKSPAG